MYALINIPGSQNFEWFGPADKTTCYDWLESMKKRHQEANGGLWQSTYYPARVVSNQVARSMRWRDGTRIIQD